MQSSIFLSENWESGFIDIGSKEQLFHMLFRARSGISKPRTLIIWLQGGPGCSGLANALTENGPYNINQDLSLRLNAYSWNNNVDLLYIDHPLGTGFSKAKDKSRIPSTREELVRDFKAFLDAFINKYPEYRNGNLFITGHSYGVRFTILYASYLIDIGYKDMSLKGISLGNGYYKSAITLGSYHSFNVENNLYTDVISQLTSSISFFLGSLFAEYELYRAVETFRALGFILFNGIISRINIYDIRRKCDFPPICYDTTTLYGFLNRTDVHKELKVGINEIWEDCSSDVFKKLVHTEMHTDITPLLVKLLNEGKLQNIVMYNGNKDWICNIKSQYALINELQWNGKGKFTNAQWKSWVVSGKVAGKYKEGGNLKFYEVNDAGHMVTFDQPEYTFDIINSLTQL